MKTLHRNFLVRETFSFNDFVLQRRRYMHHKDCDGETEKSQDMQAKDSSGQREHNHKVVLTDHNLQYDNF